MRGHLDQLSHCQTGKPDPEGSITFNTVKPVLETEKLSIQVLWLQVLQYRPQITKLHYLLSWVYAFSQCEEVLLISTTTGSVVGTWCLGAMYIKHLLQSLTVNWCPTKKPTMHNPHPRPRLQQWLVSGLHIRVCEWIFENPNHYDWQKKVGITDEKSHLVLATLLRVSFGPPINGG